MKKIFIAILLCLGVVGCTPEKISQQQVQQQQDFKNQQEQLRQQQEQAQIKNRFEIIYEQNDNGEVIRVYRDKETNKKYLWLKDGGYASASSGLCVLNE